MKAAMRAGTRASRRCAGKPCALVEPMDRRLSAILAADVAGYSALMERDEMGTHVAFRERLRSLIEPTLSAHGGHVVKRTGDGLLAELSSIVDAVKCAVEIQRLNENENLALSSDRRLHLRLG